MRPCMLRCCGWHTKVLLRLVASAVEWSGVEWSQVEWSGVGRQQQRMRTGGNTWGVERVTAHPLAGRSHTLTEHTVWCQ